jgi:hypothetical protein
MEAMRALKRRLSDIVYPQMILDAQAWATGPGGHVGAATGSSAAGSHPSTGTWEKPLPGPATNDPAPAPASPAIRSPASLPPPPASTGPQPPSSTLCLTAARTGAPSPRRERPLLTQRGAMIGVADSAGLAHDHAQIGPICVAHADYHGIAGADRIGGTAR